MINLTELIENDKIFYDYVLSCWTYNGGDAAMLFSNDCYTIRFDAIDFYIRYHSVIYIPAKLVII